MEIKDVQEIIKQINQLINCVDEEWNNMSDEAQECWENYALNVKL